MQSQTSLKHDGKKRKGLSNNLFSRFTQKNGSWFITDSNGHIGPFNDKSEAQLALVYYSYRTTWPTAKELRAFTRSNR